MCKFTIQGQLPGINQLTKGHWAMRQRIKQEAMDTVGWEIKRRGLKPVCGKVTIELQCYEPNARRDDDNVTGGAAKVILDALKNNGIIRGDGRKYVQCIKRPAEVDRLNPRIEITIIEVHT